MIQNAKGRRWRGGDDEFEAVQQNFSKVCVVPSGSVPGQNG